jgi:hypothetical protein
MKVIETLTFEHSRNRPFNIQILWKGANYAAGLNEFGTPHVLYVGPVAKNQAGLPPKKSAVPGNMVCRVAAEAVAVKLAKQCDKMSFAEVELLTRAHR